LHAENIFVGFVVPENKIFYAALPGVQFPVGTLGNTFQQMN
jgi:hypothetical protein